MDSVNTKIGQFAAREAATVVNDRSFSAANLVGFQTGASGFSKGENVVAQQVRFVDKALSDLSQKEIEQRRFKEKSIPADNNPREEKVNITSEMDDINEFFGARGTELAFSIDNGTAKQVVTVMDRETGDVIRQLPSEDALKIAAKMQEIAVSQDNAVGMLIDGKA